MSNHAHPTPADRGNARFFLLTILVLGLVLGAIWFGLLRGKGGADADVPLTQPLQRGPLRVTVLESGNLESLDARQIVNTVEGRTTIDYVIEEGTVITEEDVRKGTVLVRLNTAAIEEKRVKEEIEVAAAADNHANAVTNLEIQLQQNASDLRRADLDVRFARVDLDRYVGKKIAAELLASYAAAAGAEGGGLGATDLRRLIASLLESDSLEGEALQRIRELKSDIQLADEEHRRASERVKHSVGLKEKGYISRQEFETDKLALERRVIEKERALTARDQYVEYDFPKDVEQLISGVIEAEDRRSRAEKTANAAEAQKRSAVKSRLQQVELKRLRLKSYLEQEAACVIRATVPGLVVYSSSQSGHWRGNDERISEGATVRQGQALITIPDPSSLGVLIKVHETAIDRVRAGLEAWVEVDAVPGSRIPARVAEVNRMPDAADRWLNPDLKVYTTKLELLGDTSSLKPGMSAQVEIHVTTLADVIAVPAQAIAGTADKPAVFAWKDGEVTRRPVTLGLAAEHFVEVKTGVSVGERLLLDPPREERRAGGPTRDEEEPPAEGTEGAGESPALPEAGKAPSSRGRPDKYGVKGKRPPARSDGNGR
jgi:HlyD family secretion protein